MYTGQDIRWFIERQFQISIKSILRSINKNGFIIAHNKTSCAHFCRRKDLHQDPEDFIGSIQIPVMGSVRFFGLQFDSNTFQQFQYTFLNLLCLIRLKMISN